jgi:hypothetical protein
MSMKEKTGRAKAVELDDSALDRVQGGIAGSAAPNGGRTADVTGSASPNNGIAGSAQPNGGKTTSK